jgi:hypothetical protein
MSKNIVFKIILVLSFLFGILCFSDGDLMSTSLDCINNCITEGGVFCWNLDMPIQGNCCRNSKTAECSTKDYCGK